MNLRDALKQVPLTKSRYFQWKHSVYFNLTAKTDRTPEEFLKYVGISNFKPFELWESSTEYAYLFAVLIKERYNNDFLDVYNLVVDKAKNGDEKSILLMLKLKNELDAMVKQGITKTIDNRTKNTDSADEFDLS